MSDISEGDSLKWKTRNLVNLMERPASVTVSDMIDQSSYRASAELSNARTPSVSPGLSATWTSLSARSSAKKQRCLSGSSPGARSVASRTKKMETCFSDITLDEPGFWVWRIEGKSLVLLDGHEHGFFHEGAAHLVLKVSNDGTSSLHWWIGEETREDDITVAERKVHELDRIINYASVFTRDIQAFESASFMKNFPDGVIYIEGTPKTSLAGSACYRKRIYRVTGRTYTRAACLIPSVELIDDDHSFILDGHPRMYVWIGSNCGYIQRVKAIQIARRFRDYQRNRRTHIVVIDGNDERLQVAFLKKLPTDNLKDCNETSFGDIVQKRDPGLIVLHRVSGERVEYDMPEAATRPLYQRYLVKHDSYLLDSGPLNPISVWVGSQAKEEDLCNALKRGMIFSAYQGYPNFLPICRIREDSEPSSFKRVFSEWRDKYVKDKQLTKKYSIGNVGRALFSKSDRRTIAKLNETWSGDILTIAPGHTEIWRVDGDSLITVPSEHYGVFVNGNCYVILHKSNNGLPCNQTIYYWWGSKTSEASKWKATELALAMDETLKHKSVLIRVLDGKEPRHFMSVLQNCIMVYDGEVATLNNVEMFRIIECNTGSMHIQQVQPTCSSLSTASTAVVMTPSQCFLWYGKGSGSTERDYAKNMVSFLIPSRMYDYNIVLEDKEPITFWNILGSKDACSIDEETVKLERRVPRLSHFQRYDEFSAFEDVDNFQRKDLSEDDLFVLDTFDQIFVWCGENLDPECRKLLPNIPKAYATTDPAARAFEQVQLLYVSQNWEPEVFQKYFPAWHSTSYGGECDYDLLRKRVRQENAQIDINDEVVDKTYIGSPTYPYKTLLRQELPDDVNVDHKEYHLTDKKFQDVLRLNRAAFYRFPLWKQRQILKAAKLIRNKELTTTSH